MLGPEKLRLLIEGFNELKSGALIVLAGSLLALIGALPLASEMMTGDPQPSRVEALRTVYLVFFVIGSFAIIYGHYRYRSGGLRFAELQERYKWGYLGPTITLVAIAGTILGFLVLVWGLYERSAMYLLGLFIIGAAGLAGLVGFILFSIFLFRSKSSGASRRAWNPTP
jgi:hypothetical protein